MLNHIIVCLLLLMFSNLSIAIDQMEFLFRNQELCGNVFSDPQWIPVLDLCEMECDKQTEFCVENDELTQKCKKLPNECIEKFLKMQERPRTPPIPVRKLTRRLVSRTHPANDK